MELGGGLAPPMLGPGHAIGKPSESRSNPRHEPPAKTAQDAIAFACQERGLHLAQMAEDFPEDRFSQARIAVGISMGKGVAFRRCCSADSRERTAVELEAIT